MQTDDIYLREDLLEIYKNPPHEGVISDATVSVQEVNPMCGDVIKLDLSIKDGLIEDAKYSGSACSVSVISSSMLLDEIIGKNLAETAKFSKDELLELIGVDLTTSRVKCATLVLEALKKALNTYENTKGTKKNN